MAVRPIRPEQRIGWHFFRPAIEDTDCLIRPTADGASKGPKSAAKSAAKSAGSKTGSKKASTSKAERKPAAPPAAAALVPDILKWLDDAKAEEVVVIPLEGKSSLGDFMVVASGRNDRHVGAIAEQLREKIKATGETRVRVEGLKTCDWVLLDAGDIIVHIFRPEVREFYNLEKMWQADLRAEPVRGSDEPTEPSQH